MLGRDGVGAHLEAGDAFAFGDALVVGYGPRTEELALKHLATELDVRVWRDGTEWHQRYTDAKPGPLEEIGPTTKRGTAITFWADPAFFETTTYSFDTISRRLQEMAFLNKGLKIVLRDERPGQGKAETGLAGETSVAEEAPAPGTKATAARTTVTTRRERFMAQA